MTDWRRSTGLAYLLLFLVTQASSFPTETVKPLENQRQSNATNQAQPLFSNEKAVEFGQEALATLGSSTGDKVNSLNATKWQFSPDPGKTTIALLDEKSVVDVVVFDKAESIRLELMFEQPFVDIDDVPLPARGKGGSYKPKYHKPKYHKPKYNKPQPTPKPTNRGKKTKPPYQGKTQRPYQGNTPPWHQSQWGNQDYRYYTTPWYQSPWGNPNPPPGYGHPPPPPPPPPGYDYTPQKSWPEKIGSTISNWIGPITTLAVGTYAMNKLTGTGSFTNIAIVVGIVLFAAVVLFAGKFGLLSTLCSCFCKRDNRSYKNDSDSDSDDDRRGSKKKRHFKEKAPELPPPYYPPYQPHQQMQWPVQPMNFPPNKSYYQQAQD